MHTIDTIEALEALYDAPVERAVTKVQRTLTPLYREWIDRARFCVLTTVGPEGTDASPRGDVEPVVRIADVHTLLLPDWRGNNRLDSLRNIVRDGRASLLFMIPGSENVVRVNGDARLTADPAVTDSFSREGRTPRTVVVIRVREVYFQCAKALMRSALWSRAPQPTGPPSAGAFMREANGDFDAESYDAGYADYARPRLW